MHMKAIYLAVVSSLALAGCGSSSSGDAAAVAPPAAPQLTGTLSDSAVKGVTYTSSSGVGGTTGVNGEF